MIPGEEADARIPEPTVTFSAMPTTVVVAGHGCVRESQTKPPYSRITAIDMNTGEHLWSTGETPDRIRNNPALAGVDIGDTGTGNVVSMVVTKNLLVYSDVDHDGETALLYAIDKQSGDELGRIEVPAQSRYGMSSGSRWTSIPHAELARSSLRLLRQQPPVVLPLALCQRTNPDQRGLSSENLRDTQRLIWIIRCIRSSAVR